MGKDVTQLAMVYWMAILVISQESQLFARPFAGMER